MTRSVHHCVLISVVVACLLVSKVASAGVNQWTSHGPEGAAIYELIVDASNPATLYAGTFTAGVFKSKDGGANWNRASRSPTVEYLALSASSPNVLYAVGQSSVYKTTDGGSNWTFVGTLPVGAFITLVVTGLAVDPTDSNIVWAGANEEHDFGLGTIWKSTDGGSSWQRVNGSLPGSGSGVGIIAIDPRSPHAVFAEAQGFQKTLDGGATWTQTSGLPDSVTGLAFPSGAPSVVVAGTYGSGVFRSLDGGLTWVSANLGLSGDALKVSSVAAVDGSPGSLFAATQGGVYRSDDLGESWRIVSGGARRLLRADPSSSSVLYAVDLGVEKSLDGGITWASASHGMIATSIAAVAVSSSGHFYATMQDRNVFSTSDGGATWTRTAAVPFPEGVHSLLADPRVPSTIYAGSCGGAPGGFVYRSLDDGATWSQLGTAPNSACVLGLAVSPGNPGTLFAAVGTLYRLPLDSGVWQPTSVLGTSVWVDPTQPESVWAGGSAGVSHSEDGGLTWTSAGLDKPISAVAGDAQGSGFVYAATEQFVFGVNESVFRTTDGGHTWLLASAGLPDYGVASLVVDPRTPVMAYATTEFGVYRTVNGGLGWERFDAGLANAVNQLAVDPGMPRLFAATSGFGVASWDLTNERVVPAAASLHGVAPTYFHSDVSIFNASSSQTASIKATYRCFSGSCGEAVGNFDVAPRQAVFLSDISVSLFGAPETGGPVELESAEPISVTSRLFTPTLPAPTTGMFVPGLDPADASSTQVLLLLSHSADPAAGSRTNVGVFNPTDADQGVTFRFFEAGGTPVGSLARHLGARQAVQVNDADVAAALGLTGDLPSFYAIVESDGGAPLVAYAAVVDNRSEDLFFVRGREVITLGLRNDFALHNVTTLPAVASLHGRNGAVFLSDVAVFNPLPFSSTVTARYRCFPAPCTVSEQTLTLEAGEMRVLTDIVNTLFGAPETGGAVELDARLPIVVGSRLYTPAGLRPSVGMFVPGLAPGAATSASVLTSLSHSADPTRGFRTNVGLFNASDEAQTAGIDVYDLDSHHLGGTLLSLAAREARQVNDVFLSLGIHGDVPHAYCLVRGEKSLPLFTYAAVVDNQSQDPVFIPGESDPNPPPLD